LYLFNPRNGSEDEEDLEVGTGRGAGVGMGGSSEPMVGSGELI